MKVKTKTTIEIENADEFAKLNGIEPTEEAEQFPETQIFVQGIHVVDVLGILDEDKSGDDTLIIHINATEETRDALERWFEEKATDEELGRRTVVVTRHDEEGQPTTKTTYFGVTPLGVAMADFRFGEVYVVAVDFDELDVELYDGSDDDDVDDSNDFDEDTDPCVACTTPCDAIISTGGIDRADLDDLIKRLASFSDRS